MGGQYDLDAQTHALDGVVIRGQGADDRGTQDIINMYVTTRENNANNLRYVFGLIAGTFLFLVY